MKREESDSRLRWAFGLAVLLHVGALAVVAHLPLAQASSSPFDQLTVFGADAPFSSASVTLVDVPSPRPAASGSTVSVAPPPGPGREEQPEVRTAPPTPPQPSRPTGTETRRPEAPMRPTRPEPAPHLPAAAGPVSPDGGGGQPTGVGAVDPGGTVPGPAVTGGEGGEAPPAPAALGGGPVGTTASGDGGNGGASDRQGRDRAPGAAESQAGDPQGSPETANADSARVAWANPKVVHAARPVYPEAAAANGVEGTVVMKVLVGERGQVVEAEVLQSSHDPRLDKAALNAVRQWRYEPATQDGKAHPVYTRATVRFKLK